MFLEDLKRYKRNTGMLVFLFGIALMTAGIITGIQLAPKIKEVGLLNFFSEDRDFRNYIYTLFTAGFPIGAGISVIGAAILSDAGRKRIWWYAWLLVLAALFITLIPIIFG